MSFARYPAYKDSGVAWLGEVPEHWRVVRLKDVAKVINGYPFDSKFFSADGEFPLIRIRDLDEAETATRYAGKFVAEAAVTSSDVLIGMDGDFNVGQWRGDQPALLNQRMCCVRTDDINRSTILRHALPIPLKRINDITYATTVKHLSSFDVERTRFAFPVEQHEVHAIATFLDRETAKIDALVAEQAKLIALLQEKRQAVISHAVTQGLDPSVPMKDSGVEWLGEVPAHWEVAAVNYRYEVLLGKMLDEKRITGRHLAPYLRNVDVQWDCINTEDLPQMDFSGDDIQRYRLTSGLTFRRSPDAFARNFPVAGRSRLARYFQVDETLGLLLPLTHKLLGTAVVVDRVL
ncbi:MAG: restriction endonuclease subunit S [Ottowia sp.]